jgi:hypothetical protein
MSNINIKHWQKLAGLIKEQAKVDTAPESLNPSREDEMEWIAQNADEINPYTFPERLPPGHEDYGFNAVVIQDIGEELLSIEANKQDLAKAEILCKRLSKAIEALKVEIQTKK